jgi:hypothetical protein
MVRLLGWLRHLWCGFGTKPAAGHGLLHASMTRPEEAEGCDLEGQA